MRIFSRYVIGTTLSFALVSGVACAQNDSNTDIMACGKAQLAANKCLTEGEKATTGMFASLAAKVTTSDIGKTAAGKAAGQTASMACKSKTDVADIACKLVEKKE